MVAASPLPARRRVKPRIKDRTRHDEVTDTTVDDFCYLTTTGRRTGRPHRIEIWYAAEGSTLYMLSGGGRSSDWVRNLLADPAVLLEIDGDAADAPRLPSPTAPSEYPPTRSQTSSAGPSELHLTPIARPVEWGA